MWSGEHPAGVAGYNHSLKRRLVVAAPAANQQQDRPRWLQSSPSPTENARLAFNRKSLFRLFYQAEIRHRQIPSPTISNTLAATDARDRTT